MSFEILWRYAPSLLSGFGVTILCWGLGSAIGLVIGFVIALLYRLPLAPLRWLLRICIEIIRGTPFLVQLFLLYSGGPFIGLRLEATTAGILGLALYSAAYFAEAFRAGFSAVPRGQLEAAVSIGMNPLDILWRVSLPTMLVATLPAIVNLLIVLSKGDRDPFDYHRARTDVSDADDGGRDLHRFQRDFRDGDFLLAAG